jgi:exodeoxyribonuclease V gamma subunit
MAATDPAEGAGPVLVRHPLQPFDARNFVAGELGELGPFSFDEASYAGARSTLSPRAAARPFLPGPLSETAVSDTSLDDLVAFLERPVRGFLRQRLQLASPEEEAEPDDSIPVVTDALAQWEVGDRILRAGLAGVGKAEAVRAERLRGGLPPGALGDAVLVPIARDVEQLVDRTAGLRAGESRSVDVSVELEDGTRLAGTVTGVHQDRVVRVEFSRLNARHRLRAWVQLLALTAGRTEHSWCAATVGRGRDGPAMSALAPPAPDEARALLGGLVALRRSGLREPLPLAARTSCAYAEVRGRGGSVTAAEAKAAGEWRKERGDGTAFGDFEDPAHLRVWGPLGLRELLALHRLCSGEPYDDEPHRFGQLARQVWAPLLGHEGRH